MKKHTKKLFITLCTLATSLFAMLASGCASNSWLNQLTCEHDFGAMPSEVLKEATCSEEGEELWTCQLCNATETRSLSMKKHTRGIGQEKRAATCSVKGEMLYICTVCGAEEIEDIPKIAHKSAFVDSVAPTCTKNGVSAYAYCTDCNIFIVPKKTLPMLGHSPQVVRGEAATCTMSGKTDGKECAVCDTVLKAQEVIPATGHLVVQDKAVEATCTMDGKTAGSHCPNCGTVHVAQQTIAALGHSYGNDTICDVCGEHRHTEVTLPAVAATCIQEGKTVGSMCSVCEMIIVPQEKIPMTGHTMQNGLCTVCGAEHEHTVVALPVVAATCTSVGKTAGSKCADCGKILLAQQDIPMLSHKEETLPAVAPTCLETGLTEGSICSVCDTVLTEQTTVAAKGHTSVKIPAVAATCTEAGKTEGSECSVCKSVLTAPTSIAPTGHDFYTRGICRTCKAPATQEGLQYSLKSDGTYMITGINNNVVPENGRLYIPATYNNKAITEIKYNAFNDVNHNTVNYALKQVVFVNSNIAIFLGTGCFANNSELEAVYFTRSAIFEADQLTSTTASYLQFKNCQKLSYVGLMSTTAYSYKTESGALAPAANLGAFAGTSSAIQIYFLSTDLSNLTTVKDALPIIDANVFKSTTEYTMDYWDIMAYYNAGGGEAAGWKDLLGYFKYEG